MLVTVNLKYESLNSLTLHIYFAFYTRWIFGSIALTAASPSLSLRILGALQGLQCYHFAFLPVRLPSPCDSCVCVCVCVFVHLHTNEIHVTKLLFQFPKVIKRAKFLPLLRRILPLFRRRLIGCWSDVSDVERLKILVWRCRSAAVWVFCIFEQIKLWRMEVG